MYTYLPIGPMGCSVRPMHGRTLRGAAMCVCVCVGGGVHVKVCGLGGVWVGRCFGMGWLHVVLHYNSAVCNEEVVC